MKYGIPFCKGAQTRENRARFESDWFQQKRTVQVTHAVALGSVVGSGRRARPTGAELSTLQSAKVEDAGEGRPLGGFLVA
jgi:hypothetical protein